MVILRALTRRLALLRTSSATGPAYAALLCIAAFGLTVSKSIPFDAARLNRVRM